VLLDRGRRQTLLQGLNISRDVDWLDILQLANTIVFAPYGKLDRSAGIGPSSVGIPYIGGEELDKPPAASWSRANSRGSDGAPETTLTTA